MKKIILTIAGVMLASSALAAEAPKVKLGGSLDTQAGFRKQEGKFRHLDQDTTKSKLNSAALVNNTRINIDVEGKAVQGFTYGARLELYSDASENADRRDVSKIGDKIYGFVESKYGRLEAGAVKSATNQMRVDASSIARATGGIDGDFSNWVATNNSGDAYSRFQVSPGMPTFCDCSSSSNKANYFSPKLAGFQLGLSFTPDVEMIGTVARTHVVTKNSGTSISNVVETTLAYEGKLSAVTYKLAASGEFGDAKAGTIARNDVKAYLLGGQVGYKGFSVAASYGDWLKSGTPKIKKSGAKYGAENWSLGAAYEYDKLGMSVGYFESKKGNAFVGSIAPATTAEHDLSKNKFRNISVGADYQLAPGFMPYAEVSFFKFDRKAQAENNKGNLVLIGTKLKF